MVIANKPNTIIESSNKDIADITQGSPVVQAKANTAVVITHYADPFSPYSRGFQSVLARLQAVYGHQLRVDYKMGGMARTVSQWIDEAGLREDSVAQWVNGVIDQTQNPVDPNFIANTGVKTTWVGALAFTAAAKHDQQRAVRLLRRMIEAFQIESMPANRTTIAKLADEVGLNGEQIVRESFYESTISEFAWQRNAMGRSELSLSQLAIKVGDNEVFISDSFDATDYERAIDELAPGLKKAESKDALSYISDLEGNVISVKEISDVFGISNSESQRQLDRFTESGFLLSSEIGETNIWKITTSGAVDTNLKHAS